MAAALTYRAHGIRPCLWVRSQRQNRGRGQLDEERVRLLERETYWSWRPEEDRWRACVAALRGLVKREGHAPPGSTHVENGIQLGIWVATTRQRGRLTPG